MFTALLFVSRFVFAPTQGKKKIGHVIMLCLSNYGHKASPHPQRNLYKCCSKSPNSTYVISQYKEPADLLKSQILSINSEANSS